MSRSAAGNAGPKSPPLYPAADPNVIAVTATDEADVVGPTVGCDHVSGSMFPIGVGAAIAYTVGHLGLGILFNLFKLLLTLYGALAAFLLLVLLPVALLVWWLA